MTASAMAKIGGEFELIRQFFNFKPQHTQVDLGVGDDAALFRVATGHQCVVSSDMLVSGQHFFADVAPYHLGHKALAVNLSDLAAMGAEPIGFTLSLGLSQVDQTWLTEFSAGLSHLAHQFNCDLIGGDTTYSPNLVINITIFGQLPAATAILRNGAQEGDDIWLTGSVGEAAYALNLLKQNQPATMRHRLELPQPRVSAGLALRGVAHAMLDLSDGLAGDLIHILRASNCAAKIDCDALPLGSTLLTLPLEHAWRYAITGGDDYELCFTASIEQRKRIQAIAQKIQMPFTRIGSIQKGTPKIVWCSTKAPQLLDNTQQWSGYDHFAKG